jgi:hypothetical protein
MAYSDFKAQELVKKFGVKFKAGDLFPNVEAIAPSGWLTESLARGQNLGFGSEKSRSERLVTPILLEMSERHRHSFAIYSGMRLDVDEALGLNGECDFIFSFSRIQDFVTAPVFCVTEAKKQDLEQGTVQCAAQLIGAQRFNQMEGNPVTDLFGAVTTGIEWRFLQLSGHEVVVDENRYLITDLPLLLGIFDHIIGLVAKEAVSL